MVVQLKLDSKRTSASLPHPWKPRRAWPQFRFVVLKPVRICISVMLKLLESSWLHESDFLKCAFLKKGKAKLQRAMK